MNRSLNLVFLSFLFFGVFTPLALAEKGVFLSVGGNSNIRLSGTIWKPTNINTRRRSLSYTKRKSDWVYVLVAILV